MDVPAASSRQPLARLAISAKESWLSVFVLLLLGRACLTLAALIGANSFPLREVVTEFTGENPRILPGVWVRWDSGYFLDIAANGYSADAGNMVFLPLYPLLIRMFAGLDPQRMEWSGFLVANISFLFGAVLLWIQVKQHFGLSAAWGTVVALSLFPTSWSFSAVYSEGLFLLLSSLVWFASIRRLWALAGLLVCLASLTRITGPLLAVIPIVEVLSDRHPGWLKKVVGIVAISGTGVLALMGYSWYRWGTPIQYLVTQEDLWEDRISWPWETVADAFASAAWGYGGLEGNWFMRVVSAFDLTLVAVLAICTVVAVFRLPSSLAAYSAVSLLMICIGHGPYMLGLMSASRYVVVVFPCFIVIGLLLARRTRLKWCFWTLSGGLLLFLTGWFANGGWVA